MKTKAERTMSRFLTALLLASALTACATTDAGRRDVGTSTVDQSSRMASLDLLSKKYEEKVRQSGGRIKDVSLNDYVNNLVQKSAGKYSQELRVYLLEAPAFNAFMLPNGAMAVYSGLMLRADNEAELFAVLGHEFGHYVEQHSMEQSARAENTKNAMTFINIATLGYASPLVLLAGVSNFMAFSREHESEADGVGFDRMVAEGYDPNAAAQIWINLKAEEQASSNKKRRKRGGRERSALFDSHPTPQDRLDALTERANELSDIDGSQNAETYRARIRPFLLDWYTAELQMRDFGATLNLIERKRAFGEDLGLLDYVEGRAYMLRDEDGDRDRAITVWTTGSMRSDVPAILFRDLGDIYQKAGRDTDARAAFQNYLDAAPNAPDIALVRSLIDK